MTSSIVGIDLSAINADTEIITHLYNGRAVITFKPEYHAYTIAAGGRDYRHPSVTGVLSVLSKGEGLLSWSAGVACDRVLQIAGSTTLTPEGLKAIVDLARTSWRQAREDAATVGTYVHRALGAVLEGNPVSYPDPKQAWMLPLIHNAVDAGLRFFEQHSIRVRHVEQPRWSAKHGFLGTGDLIGIIDNELAVLDFKTGRAADYVEFFAQTAGYQIAFEEEFPSEVVKARWVVRVGKDGVLAHSRRDARHHEKDKQAFLDCLSLFRWKQLTDRWVRDVYDGPLTTEQLKCLKGV